VAKVRQWRGRGWRRIAGAARFISYPIDCTVRVGASTTSFSQYHWLDRCSSLDHEGELLGIAASRNVVAHRPRNITDIVQTDHFEITVLATAHDRRSQTIGVTG
jgi:hypothetical protein